MHGLYDFYEGNKSSVHTLMNYLYVYTLVTTTQNKMYNIPAPKSPSALPGNNPQPRWPLL